MTNIIAGGGSLDWVGELTFKTSDGKSYKMVEHDGPQSCCNLCCLNYPKVDGREAEGCRLDLEEFGDLACWGGDTIKGQITFYFKEV